MKQLLIALLLPIFLLGDERVVEIALGTHALFGSAHWGLVLIDGNSKKVLLSHNRDQFFIPASVTKLFTTFAPLEILTPAH